VVEDGVNGRLVRSLTPAAFAAVVKEFLEMPGVRRHAVELAARETVATRFDARLIAERLLNVYKAALGGARGE
jgi:glycosyltransferase involved in cell wall biosynthesis